VYSVEVVIDGNGQAELSAKEFYWRNALASPNRDFVLKQNSGAASSAAIFVRDTMSGTRVANIACNEATGGEFVNRRTIRFQVHATYKVKNSDGAVVAWQESIVIVGNGGPDYQWRFPVNAGAIREMISPTSLVRATQSGMAIGHTIRPFRPNPIWPVYMKNIEDVKGIDTPQFAGREYINYPVRWSYTFERGDGPLIGLPNLPSGA
jgi:hypothetical protein